MVTFGVVFAGIIVVVDFLLKGIDGILSFEFVEDGDGFDLVPWRLRNY